MGNTWKTIGLLAIGYLAAKACSDDKSGCSRHRDDDHDKKHKTEQVYTTPCPAPQIIIQPVYTERTPAQSKSSNKPSVDAEQDKRLSDLETKIQESKQEVKEEQKTITETTTAENYKQYNANERRKIDLRNECDRNSMMVNNRQFYINYGASNYGTWMFNGISRGGMFSFSMMTGPNQYTPVYIPQNQFFRYIQSVEVDGSNNYYLTFKQSTRPSEWSRAMNTQMMFAPGYVPR